MVRIYIAGHITLDTIIVGRDARFQSIGGPPSYSGLFLTNTGVSVAVGTRVGPDFGSKRLRSLEKRGLDFVQPVWSKSPTTRFLIKIQTSHARRSMKLVSRCDNLEIGNVSGVDACIVSPVIGEVSPREIPRLRPAHFIYLDPQGFLRVNKKGYLKLEPNAELLKYLSSVDATKVDLDEGQVMTGSRDPAKIASILQGYGVREVLVTSGGRMAYLFYEGKQFAVKVPSVKPLDGVGAGDIFGAAYTLCRLFESPERSIEAAVKAASLLIHLKGLRKVYDRKAFRPVLQILPLLPQNLAQKQP